MTEEELTSVVNPLVKESLELRFNSKAPERHATPQEVLDSLLYVRQRLDRVEAIYVELLSIRGKLSRKCSEATAISEEAWANALGSIKSSKTVKEEFIGPRERYAEADLAVLMEKRSARQIQNLLSVAEDSVDTVKMCLRGLNDLRQDHLAWLRTLQFNSSLET